MYFDLDAARLIDVIIAEIGKTRRRSSSGSRQFSPCEAIHAGESETATYLHVDGAPPGT